jgi:tyrosinase
LTPFRYDDDAYWTANSARSTRTFGYTFPEIDDWNGSPEDLSRRVRGRVNALYNQRRPTARKHKRHINKHSNEERGLDLGKLGTNIVDGLTDLVEDLGDLLRTSLDNFAELGVNNLGKQWVINVGVDKYVIS